MRAAVPVAADSVSAWLCGWCFFGDLRRSCERGVCVCVCCDVTIFVLLHTTYLSALWHAVVAVMAATAYSRGNTSVLCPAAACFGACTSALTPWLLMRHTCHCFCRAWLSVVIHIDSSPAAFSCSRHACTCHPCPCCALIKLNMLPWLPQELVGTCVYCGRRLRICFQACCRRKLWCVFAEASFVGLVWDKLVSPKQR